MMPIVDTNRLALKYKPQCFPQNLRASSPLHKVCLVLGLFCLLSLGHATSTQECRWHAAYFDAVFIGNYGTVNGAEKYINDVTSRANVIMKLDSLLKSFNQQGKLKNFKRWLLIDDYFKNIKFFGGRTVPDSLRVVGREVYLCLTDSLAINKALKKLWNIKDVIISPNKPAGMWLFSLHVGFDTDPTKAGWLMPEFKYHARPDSNLLWLKMEGDVYTPYSFYQHETDGYYHTYTGLYLTRANVFQAQKLLLEIRDLKTTIVSHYVTPTIIRKYAY